VASAWKNNRKLEIGNLKLQDLTFLPQSARIRGSPGLRNARSVARASVRETISYPGSREKISLAIWCDPAKSGEHEVCSSVRIRLPCGCVANVGGFATALSGQTGATI